jgi:hypothetical protein
MQLDRAALGRACSAQCMQCQASVQARRAPGAELRCETRFRLAWNRRSGEHDDHRR